MRGNEDRIVDLLCWHNIHDRAFMAPCGMDLLTHTWCRSPRRPYFSLLVQRKVGKRNTPRRSARRYAAGAQSRWEFSDGASCPGRKRRTSLCAALRVFFPPGLPDLRGPGSKSKRVRDLLVLLLVLFGAPMRHGERAG